MLLALPLVGFILGLVIARARPAMIATAVLYAAALAVVIVADDAQDGAGGIAMRVLAAVVSVGLAWLGARLRSPRSETVS
jgi:hypothetical protein